MEFWTAHPGILGLAYLLFLTVVPRITMLLMATLGSLLSGGFLWWFGFVCTPHILVAVLATNSYWDTNPVLCAFAWMVAFHQEQEEKESVAKAARERDIRHLKPTSIIRITRT